MDEKVLQKVLSVVNKIGLESIDNNVKGNLQLYSLHDQMIDCIRRMTDNEDLKMEFDSLFGAYTSLLARVSYGVGKADSLEELGCFKKLRGNLFGLELYKVDGAALLAESYEDAFRIVFGDQLHIEVTESDNYDAVIEHDGIKKYYGIKVG